MKKYFLRQSLIDRSSETTRYLQESTPWVFAILFLLPVCVLGCVKKVSWPGHLWLNMRVILLRVPRNTPTAGILRSCSSGIPIGIPTTPSSRPVAHTQHAQSAQLLQLHRSNSRALAPENDQKIEISGTWKEKTR